MSPSFVVFKCQFLATSFHLPRDTALKATSTQTHLERGVCSLHAEITARRGGSAEHVRLPPHPPLRPQDPSPAFAVSSSLARAHYRLHTAGELLKQRLKALISPLRLTHVLFTREEQSNDSRDESALLTLDFTACRGCVPDV